MRIVRWTVVAAALLAVPFPAVQGRQERSAPRPAVDVSALGPQVGDRVPDFALEDQGGVSRTLQSIVGPKGAMLVFFRSADW
jgi:hypothetical protein